MSAPEAGATIREHSFFLGGPADLLFLRMVPCQAVFSPNLRSPLPEVRLLDDTRTALRRPGGGWPVLPIFPKPGNSGRHRVRGL